jgi:pentatricopeptide repeat protein
VARRVELENVVDETIKVRSRSTLDLYQVGIPRPRLLRAYSTAVKTLSAPNRIQMDLAGMDTPTKRNHSTEVATDDQVDYPTTPTNETDRRIYSAIYHASNDSRRDFLTSLIAHYRSPRSEPSPHPELESHLPRPEGYTVGTYNICLEALLSVRRVGESIAPLLEIYNEMLEREILPNGRTHISVIKALCLREKDVQAAVLQEAQVLKWAKFRWRNLGLESSRTAKEDKAVLEGYLAEGNFESAYNLFSGIKAVQQQSPKSFYRFHPQVYNYLLDSLATRRHPDTSVLPKAMEIFNHAVETETASHRMLYKHMFRLLAKTKDQEAVTSLWERFATEATEGQGRRMRDWKDILPGAEIEDREEQVEGFQRDVWNAAIKAFIQVGLVERGLELFGQMSARQGANVNVNEVPKPNNETYGIAIVALAEHGHHSKASELFHQASSTVGQLRHFELGQYLDALAYGGQWRLALDTYLPILANAPEDYRPDQPRIKRIYAALLGSARQSPDDLEHVPRLMSTGTYMLEPDLAITHIRLLLQQKQYAQIANVLDNFGPMMINVDRETLYSMRGSLAEVVVSQIDFQDLLRVLQSYARQRIHLSTASQGTIADIIDKYISARPTTITQEGYSALLSVFAKTDTEVGEYDDALEIFMADLAEHAPQTLKMNDRGRLVSTLAGKLFERFGSERTTLMLNPLLGEEGTTEILAEFYDTSLPSPSLPDSTPAPDQPPRSFKIDDQLSHRIDMHANGRNQITPQRAYIELRAGLSQNLIPHPDSIARLIQSLSREGDEPRVLELYNLGQTLISTTPNPKTQETWWRQFEDAMLIAQCHLGHLEQAGLHRHRLVERGMAPSADAYATMISSSKDTTDDAQVARELWEESVMMGVRPHLYLYNTVISKLSKARKAELALEMFGQMKERGVRPSSVTYGAVIVSRPAGR